MEETKCLKPSVSPSFCPASARNTAVTAAAGAAAPARLVRALAVETHENWLEQHRYLNMDDLREHKKEALRRAA
jgi:putative transposase